MMMMIMMIMRIFTLRRAASKRILYPSHSFKLRRARAMGTYSYYVTDTRAEPEFGVNSAQLILRTRVAFF